MVKGGSRGLTLRELIVEVIHQSRRDSVILVPQGRYHLVSSRPHERPLQANKPFE
jgi:hypothetical protein